MEQYDNGSFYRKENPKPEWIVRNDDSVGTVPIYQALEKVDSKAEKLSWSCSKIR